MIYLCIYLFFTLSQCSPAPQSCTLLDPRHILSMPSAEPLSVKLSFSSASFTHSSDPAKKTQRRGCLTPSQPPSPRPLLRRNKNTHLHPETPSLPRHHPAQTNLQISLLPSPVHPADGIRPIHFASPPQQCVQQRSGARAI